MFELMAQAALGMLGLSALLSLWRVVRGPTLPDRVVALDLMGVLVVAIAVTSAALSGSRFYLDVAIVIALGCSDSATVSSMWRVTRQRFARTRVKSCISTTVTLPS